VLCDICIYYLNLVMCYPTICISCYVLSNHLYILYCAIQPSVYLVLCYPTICVSCIVLSYHLCILYCAIQPSVYLVVCYPNIRVSCCVLFNSLGEGLPSLHFWSYKAQFPAAVYTFCPLKLSQCHCCSGVCHFYHF